MKDVLEFTQEELEKLSVQELQTLENIASSKEVEFGTAQMAKKTMMNSLYGALANKYFPLFNEDIASAITGNGRYFIQSLARNIENDLQALKESGKPYVLYSDTDSVYFHVEPFVDDFLEKNPEAKLQECTDFADKFEKSLIQKITAKTIQEFSSELNAYNSDVIASEREIIADSAVFVAKKKYFARVKDKEGTRYSDDNPYIKIMGLEIIKSSTPAWSKKYLKEAIPKILDNTEKELRNWVRTLKEEYYSEDLLNLCAVQGVSRLDYDLSTDIVPIGSRSSIIHNNYIREHGLEQKYQKITPGEKIKRLYLNTPNKFGSNVIGFISDSFVDEIPREAVDFNLNFEKTFIKSLEIMINCLAWDIRQETESIVDDEW